MVNLSRSAREDALLTLEETRFLAEEGDRTTIELARAELSLETRKTALYAAMVELYTLQGELLLLLDCSNDQQLTMVHHKCCT